MSMTDRKAKNLEIDAPVAERESTEQTKLSRLITEEHQVLQTGARTCPSLHQKEVKSFSGPDPLRQNKKEKVIIIPVITNQQTKVGLRKSTTLKCTSPNWP
jgi:hypothetical protein